MSTRKRPAIPPERYPWLCAGAAFLPYLASLPGKLFWDSEVLILNNVYLRDLSFLPKLFTSSVMEGGGVLTNFYRPVATTILMLCWQVWGPNPLGYHLLNVALHALNAALVYKLAERLELDRRAALVAALLFALHPIQSEQVNYPDHVEGILALTFGLSSVLSYLRGASPAATAAFYALALLSKEEGAVFGPILGILWLRREKPSFATFKALLPSALVAAAYVALRLTALNFLDLPIGQFGAQEGAYAPLPARLLTFAKALMLYARLFALPYGLHFDRDMAAAAPGELSAWACAAGAAVLFGLLWRVSDARGRFGVLWFFAGLLPYCGLVPFNNVVGEHFLYIPSVGLFMAVALLARRVPQSLLAPPARAAALATLALVYAAMDVRRSLVWQDPIKLYESTLAGNPRSYRAASNLGVERFRLKDLDGAERGFQQALAVKPDYAVALNNMGAVYESRERLAAALHYYRKAVEADPKYLLARRNLAALQLDLGNVAEGLKQLEELLALNESYDQAWKLMGVAYFLKGDHTRARGALRRGLELAYDPLTAKRLRDVETAIARGAGPR